MEPDTFVYDGENLTSAAAALRDRLSDRSGVTLVDVSTNSDARREGTLVIKEAVRVGRPPDALYDDGLDPSPGALVLTADTGRMSLLVGRDALDALDDTAVD